MPRLRPGVSTAPGPGSRVPAVRPYICPGFDEEELELAVEFGAARSCALVRELMRAPPQNIIPPRYLRWTRRLSLTTPLDIEEAKCRSTLK
jgi:hypothetical protein